jgi:hypothetical protein
MVELVARIAAPTGGDDPNEGLLKFCVQFQVLEGGALKNSMEVRSQIEIKLTEDCFVNGGANGRELCEGSISTQRTGALYASGDDGPSKTSVSCAVECWPCTFQDLDVTQGEPLNLCFYVNETLFETTGPVCTYSVNVDSSYSCIFWNRCCL